MCVGIGHTHSCSMQYQCPQRCLTSEFFLRNTRFRRPPHRSRRTVLPRYNGRMHLFGSDTDEKSPGTGPLEITVLGAGMAGSEAAWQAAERGARVRLVEMRPVKQT